MSEEAGTWDEELNTCKVVNRKFDTGISYRIEALGAEKKEKKEEGKRKKIRRAMCAA